MPILSKSPFRRSRRNLLPGFRLPPTNRKGVETRFARLGFRKNPVLSFREGAKVVFDKPLPDRRRIDVKLHEYPRHFVAKVHIDSRDPYRDPLGHVLKDFRVRRRGRTIKIPKSYAVLEAD
jgi:hypothetical protein